MQSTLLVNGVDRYQLEKIGNEIYINHVPISADILCAGAGTYHVLYNRKSFQVQVLSQDAEIGALELLINGRPYCVSKQTPFADLLKALGMSGGRKNGIEILKAPMPGMVLEVSVSAGDQVSKGDNLLVLEAMKMENVIKSPADVTVKSVEVVRGASVEKNQVLLTFHDSF